MKAIVFKLRFIEGDRPGAVAAWVALGDHSSATDGSVLVSPQCAGIAEFEGYIDRMHGELEELRKQAKRRFSAHKARYVSPAANQED